MSASDQQCVFFLLFCFSLRNVLHNMSQTGVKNKNCLGMFTVQWLSTDCSADPPTLEGRTHWSQLPQSVSPFVPVRSFPVRCASICWVTPPPGWDAAARFRGPLTPEEANGCLWSLMQGAKASEMIRQIKRALMGTSRDTAKRPSGIPECAYQFVFYQAFLIGQLLHMICLALSSGWWRHKLLAAE